MMPLVIAACVERYRNNILQVYQRAFREKSAVLWQSFRSTPRSNTYQHELRRLYSQQPADWWISPTHLTLLGAAFTQRRTLEATVVEAFVRGRATVVEAFVLGQATVVEDFVQGQATVAEALLKTLQSPPMP